jgi:hypothetical protein
MAKHIVCLPTPDGSLLLRELNHRIHNELTCTICTVAASARESDDAAIKAALLDVVELLHQCTDVHRVLRMPDQEYLIDVAKCVRQLSFDRTSAPGWTPRHGWRPLHAHTRALRSADYRAPGLECKPVAIFNSSVDALVYSFATIR